MEIIIAKEAQRARVSQPVAPVASRATELFSLTRPEAQSQKRRASHPALPFFYSVFCFVFFSGILPGLTNPLQKVVHDTRNLL